MTQHHHDHLDPELRPLATALDELGDHERNRAPAGLEQRLLAGTLPALRGNAHADMPDADASPVVARIGFRRAMRLAAAVAVIAAGGAAAWLMLRPNPAPRPTPIAKVTTEQLIEEINTEADDWFADLDSLQTTADTTSSTSTDFWSLPDEDALDTLLGEENS
jgi:hypothetical protein